MTHTHTRSGLLALTTAAAIACVAAIITPSCTLSDDQRQRNLETRQQIQALTDGVGNLAFDINAGMQATNETIATASAAINTAAESIAEERRHIAADPDIDPATAEAATARLEAIEETITGLAATIESSAEDRQEILQQTGSTLAQIQAVAERMPALIDETGAVNIEVAEDIVRTGIGFAPEPYRSIAYAGLGIASAFGSLVFGTRRGRRAERTQTTMPVYRALGDVVRGTSSVLEMLHDPERINAENLLRERQSNGATHGIVAAIRGRGVSGIVEDLERR